MEKLVLSVLALFLLSSVTVEGGKKIYIVHVERPQYAALDSNAEVETWYKSFLPATLDSSSDSARVIHAYKHVMSGFAVTLTETEVAEMSKKEGFLQARPARKYSLKTTHTPGFLGLNLPMGLWNQSYLGQGVIVGLLDTGITPGHPSFDGANMPPPPAKWKGWCDLPAGYACNNKLIGARFFLDGAIADGENVTRSPVDEGGHGTHTSSTAAGAFVADAQALGNAGGIAAGMAPSAHVAMYRVCGLEGCFDADMLAGMDAAISDGVDVLSISIGGQPVPFYEDTLAVGGFRAIEKGIFVSCAAGNSGPYASTLSNEAPWLLTVAASTTDRRIRATVMLENGYEFEGESLFQPKNYLPTFSPLVYAGAAGKPGSLFCKNGTLDSSYIEGKVVVCERGGDIGRIDKGVAVKAAGGIGMILTNQAPDAFSTLAEAHVLPASHVSYADGLKIKSYINSTINPMAAIAFKGSVFAVTPSPAITSFSSRGPSMASPGILKPDITGPGVSILAAWPFPLDQNSEKSGLIFNVISGTSMSTPHLGGIAALIKNAHPDWSPAAIKSAIMTTADVLDKKGLPIADEQHRPADLFATGAGHVNPLKANDPGLVYDLHAEDYLPYLCGLGYNNTEIKVITGYPIDCSNIRNITETDLNYPSISASFKSNSTCVATERTVTNVGEADSMYWAEVDTPVDVSVVIEPKVLKFYEVSQEMTFKVTFCRGSLGGHGSVSQGYLKWVSKSRTVRSPISVTFN